MYLESNIINKIKKLKFFFTAIECELIEIANDKKHYEMFQLF